MFYKTAIALAATLAFGSASIATDAFARNPEHSNGRTHNAASYTGNTARHAGNVARHGGSGRSGGRVAAGGSVGSRYAGHRGEYSPGYGSDNAYYAQGSGYDSSYNGPDDGYDSSYSPGYRPCLPIPIPVIGCW